MRIYSITSSNYNNVNLNRTNDISKPAFKGKNFAKVLSEFRFRSFDGCFYRERAFNGFRYLMENVSKEPHLQIVKEDVYKELEAANTEEAFYDLLKNWYNDDISHNKAIIAKDSEGPIIKYTNNQDGKILQFMSKDAIVSIKTKDAFLGKNIMGVIYECTNSSDSNDGCIFD